MVASDPRKSLENKLTKLSKIFDFNEVLAVEPDLGRISDYYRINKIPYSLFHSNKDLFHMGISRDHKYKEEDLFEQVKFVGKYINKLGARRVLELAAGGGTNSLYLAMNFPEAQFTGLDLPNVHTDLAKRKTKLVDNFKVVEGNFHDLSVFDEGRFDLVFIIEALCYSQRKIEVFRQVKRILKPGGLFIVFDAYHRYKSETLDNNVLLAGNLVAKGMMIEKFEYYGDLKFYAESSGFKLIFEEDVTEFVLPTAERFEKLVKLLLKVPYLLKFLCTVLPSEFTNNVISGYLMPDSIRLNIALYAITVFQI